MPNVTETLTKRIDASYLRARRSFYFTRPTILTPGPLHGEPILPVAFPAKKLTPSLNFNKPGEVYPEVPSLATSEQVEKYLVARNNRAIPNELKYLADQAEKVADHMSVFKREAALCEQPDQQIPWLVDRIGPNVNYLFVGEMHGYPEVRQAMSKLLSGLRQKYPQRKIILLTEFLTNDISTQEVWQAAAQQPTIQARMDLLQIFENIGKDRLSGEIWETLHANNIEVVGLEPTFVFENQDAVFIPEEPQDHQDLNLWWSDEGIRLRHKHWENRIRVFRQQHPDALFVIYGGGAHFAYFRSPAISKRFPETERLTVSLFPRKHWLRGADGQSFETEDNMGWFAQITQNQFPQYTLYWQTQQSALLSGFDYQLKVPPLR